MTNRVFRIKSSKNFLGAGLLILCCSLSIAATSVAAPREVDSYALLRSEEGNTLADEILGLLKGSGSFRAAMERFCATHASSSEDLDACLDGLEQSLTRANTTPLNDAAVDRLIAPSLEMLAQGGNAEAAAGDLATALSTLLCKAGCYLDFFLAVQQAINNVNEAIADCCSKNGGTVGPGGVTEDGLPINHCTLPNEAAVNKFNRCMNPWFNNPSTEYREAIKDAKEALEACLAGCNGGAAQ